MRSLQFTLVSLFVALAAGKTIEKSWTLSHSNGVDAPSKRATIRLLSNSDDHLELTIDDDQDSSSMDSMLSNSPKFYQLILQENGKNAPVIKTSILACQLLRANLRDELVLTFGQQGTVMSMSYSPMISALAPPTCEDLQLREGANFSTKIDYEVDRPGMQLKTVLPQVRPPPGLNYLPGSSRAAGGGSQGQNDNNQQQQQQSEQPTSLFGYLTKYWYIVVPLMLMNLLAEPAREDGEGGSPQQDASGNAAAPAPAPAAQQSTTQRRGRRGKRG